MNTEPLTDAMLTALRSEAAAAGDEDTIEDALNALFSDVPSDKACGRARCCLVINDARARDESKPLVRVVP